MTRPVVISSESWHLGSAEGAKPASAGGLGVSPRFLSPFWEEGGGELTSLIITLEGGESSGESGTSLGDLRLAASTGVQRAQPFAGGLGRSLVDRPRPFRKRLDDHVAHLGPS